MSILISLFGKSKSSENTGKKPTFLIVANEVFSHGWNDPSEILDSKHSIILDTVSDYSVGEKLNYWNKKYYDFFTQHYSVSEEQFEKISPIMNVDPDKYRELYAYWPKELNVDVYNKISELLNLKFVKAIPVTDNIKGKYAIVLNEEFWNIPKHNSNVLVDIINTYERSFNNFELLHENEEEALNFGIIIYDRLCIERPPDTDYFYHEKIKKQISLSDTIPSFNYNTNLYKEEDKKNEYSRIISEHKDDLKKMRFIISKISEKPFEIIRI